jgi:hypothetical protein
MSRIKNVLLISLGIAMVDLVISNIDARRVQATDLLPPAQVKVVNKTTEAVPVATQGTVAIAGNVNVTNTPSVNVVGLPAVQSQQSGPWSVGINNTPTVMAQQAGAWTQTIANTADSPVLVRSVDQTTAQKPFQKDIQLSAICGQASAVGSFSVPAGKRLIIQNLALSALAINPIDQNNAVKIAEMDTIFNGQLGEYPLDFHARQSPSGDPRYVFNSQILAFADSQTDVSFRFEFDEPIGVGTCGSLTAVSGTVSGYLIDMP